ncbi:MAG TPA: sigma-70 family RNA polymerase sigma factor [Methylophaga aminisulfidivorans]|uniref:Sigma-70 family RNA polymerase sigma factor n=2 Tax=root TaxID=1 RepID=A0A7C1VNM4_9GAMM|nr:sigma-70 family RNA polymerase sigma factor [Methylophaga aminisulfidivorans]
MKKIFKRDQTNEKELIEQLIKGDSAAFELVVGTYHSLMLSVARAIIGQAFADEVVQDAWVSAIKALPKFEGRSSLKTWLLQITSNGAKTRVRRESRQLSLDDGWESISADKFDHTGHRLDDVLPWEEDTPDALLENEQLQAIIEERFNSLPANQRAVLTMYDMEGMEMKEICNILDLSASNVRVLLHRARTTLHHTIENYRDN